MHAHTPFFNVFPSLPYLALEEYLRITKNFHIIQSAHTKIYSIPKLLVTYASAPLCIKPRQKKN